MEIPAIELVCSAYVSSCFRKLLMLEKKQKRNQEL